LTGGMWEGAAFEQGAQGLVRRAQRAQETQGALAQMLRATMAEGMAPSGSVHWRFAVLAAAALALQVPFFLALRAVELWVAMRERRLEWRGGAAPRVGRKKERAGVTPGWRRAG
jgi:hypothetical protein